MIFANWFGDLFGQACVMLVIGVWGIGWLLSKALNSNTGQDAAKIGVWWWLTKDD